MQRKLAFALRLVFLGVFLGPLGCSSPPSLSDSKSAPQKATASFAFDADDNLFFMPTQVYVFHNKSGKAVGIPTGKFAVLRNEIGKPGTRWAEYSYRSDVKTGSFREFSDLTGEDNIFLRHLKLAQKGPHWKGPAFEEFQQVLAQESTAQHTTILTSRGHEPENIFKALLYLKDQGLLARAPPVEGIWTITHPQWVARYEKAFGKKPADETENPALRKALVIESLLDEISARPLSRNSPKVREPSDPARTGAFHLWTYSDDDWNNIEKAAQLVQRGLDAQRWPNLKVTLVYTGTENPDRKAHAFVLRPGKTSRPREKGEEREWRMLVNDSH